MEIRKIENKDYVMLPRLQHPGLKPQHVERDAFKAELKHIEGHGDFWLLYWWYEYGEELYIKRCVNLQLSVINVEKNL